jgi:hypothetical protein
MGADFLSASTYQRNHQVADQPQGEDRYHDGHDGAAGKFVLGVELMPFPVGKEIIEGRAAGVRAYRR